MQKKGGKEGGDDMGRHLEIDRGQYLISGLVGGALIQGSVKRPNN